MELHEEQELQQVDDQTASVFYLDGTQMFRISAEAARDARGSAVPTSLRIDDGNVVTLVVSHWAGNPAAGGASFVYPITAGEAFEAGKSTVRVVMPPAEPIPEGEENRPVPTCVVPKLGGSSLKGERRKLKRAGCKVGKVWGERSRAARVVRQTPRPGEVLAAGAKVHVKLGE